MRAHLVAPFALTIFVLFVEQATACYCDDYSNTVPEADAIFDGTVVGSVLIRTFDRSHGELVVGGIPGEQLTIEVDQVFRGDVGPVVQVRDNAASCRVGNLSVGAKVFIIAREADSEGVYDTNQCAGSRRISHNAENPMLAYVAEKTPLRDYSPARLAKLRGNVRGEYVQFGSIE